MYVNVWRFCICDAFWTSNVPELHLNFKVFLSNIISFIYVPVRGHSFLMCQMLFLTWASKSYFGLSVWHHTFHYFIIFFVITDSLFWGEVNIFQEIVLVFVMYLLCQLHSEMLKKEVFLCDSTMCAATQRFSGYPSPLKNGLNVCIRETCLKSFLKYSMRRFSDCPLPFRPNVKCI